MATHAAVNEGSKFCRFCGGPTTERGGFCWCENAPSEKCELLIRSKRSYCELCGKRDPGGEVCRHCQRLGLLP